MRKTITYQWHLAELMAKAGMHNSTDLLPHLLERGIDLSPSQAYRLVTGRPERLSLPFRAAPGSCPMVIEVNPRNTAQGRPRTSGSRVCARCYRAAAKYRIRWPEGPICGICFHNAMRTHGNCAHCGTDRLLPGIDELSAA